MEPPTRICCGQKHFGVVCPDGKVMCCVCFYRVSQDKLNTLENGMKEDCCLDCANKEKELKKLKELTDK